MSISELSNRTVYRGQKLLFLGTIKATIKNVYINGQSTHSGYFSPMTKPIFRSESARYVLFIQMSKEMWDFDAEGAGEIMFNKVVNGFLPDLFKRWMRINARHLVTIILFTRMTYDGEPSTDHPEYVTQTTESEKPAHHRDYYRVVVSDMASGDWIHILYQLRKEFRAFLRDVSLVPKAARKPSNSNERNEAPGEPDLVISGKPCTASQGNVLEAINLASAQFAKDYIDRDLVRTGISVVVITAGTGVFEVDYNMLKLTTDTLVGSGIGIDLVCLSPMPLHSVPLFKYRSPRTVSNVKADGSKSGTRQGSIEGFNEHDDKTPRQHQPNFGSASRDPAPPVMIFPPESATTTYDDADEWRYAMPHWVDISFWSGPSDEIIELSRPKKPIKSTTKTQNKGSSFALRCRMYELQMMGVMENELGGISIPYLEETVLYPHRLKEFMEAPENAQDKMDTVVKSVAASDSYSARVEKDIANGQHDQDKLLYKSWMEAYDEQMFSPLTDGQSHIQHFTLHSKSDTSEKHESLAHFPDDTSLSTSYRSVGSSFGKTARPPPGATFHQLMRERSREFESHSPRSTIYRPADARGKAIPRADVVLRQLASGNAKMLQRTGHHRRGNSGDSNDYRRSMHSTPNDSPAVSRGNTPPKRSGLPPLPSPRVPLTKAEPTKRPGGWFLRQFSFGGKGAGLAEPTTSLTTVDAARDVVAPARPNTETKQKGTIEGAIAPKLTSTRFTKVVTPSQPIDIRAVSRTSVPTADAAVEDTARSVDTVRNFPRVEKWKESHQEAGPNTSGSTVLYAGSRALTKVVGPKPVISPSGGAKEVPRTLSPTSAIAPWAVLVNPCNPRKNTLNVATQFRRWQHVFPKRLKTSSVKWKSLCSPAAVPLTNEYFPTAEQLRTEYNESPYKIAQNDDDDVPEAPKSRESLIRELIAFRLSHGFQIIVGPAVAEFTGGREQDLSNILHSEYMSNDGDTVFMCVGNTIHQLVCAAGGEVEVKRFNRKPTTALLSSAGIDTPFPYKPYIRTALEQKYHPRDLILRPPRREYNWNFIDTFLAGYDDEFSEKLRFWRARFVLIPVEIPSMHRRALPLLTEDSEEEIRLEGIRKLTQLWQRFRYVPPEERPFQASTAKKQKDPNPLAIEYHTRDPSAIVAAGPDSALLHDFDSEFQTALFSETEQYHSSNIDIKRLAEDLQGEKGIPMLDRRWHWRLHYNCFLGFDLTSWLLSNFKDIETRDEAVDLGNRLMNKGLFQHVQKRHQFRDGNFFFQIAAEYRAPRPDTKLGWFGMKRVDRSIPSTPLSEGPRTSPLTARSIVSRDSRPGTNDSSSTSESAKEGDKTPTRASTTKRKVTLSRVMRYDVDARKRSYRPEIISLHYDRLHNPDNCYHIRIDWMNVTAKLIEDAIVTWATSVEKYGLKLVEVPIAEASNITDHHPFRSPYIIKLALQPPKITPEQVWDPSHFSPQSKTDNFAYHKALLRKMNFVLDMEAASAFCPDVEVSYSWGHPDYKYTQFIHRSGLVLAQITDEGDFLLLANRLAHNRAKDNTKFRATDPYEHKRTTTTGTGTNPSTPALDRSVGMRSPFSSPLARPVQDSGLLHTTFHHPSNTNSSTGNTPLISPGHSNSNSNASPAYQNPEQIKEELEAFCASPKQLRAFYDTAFQQIMQQQTNAATVTASPSPRIYPVLESQIPTLGLPPAMSPAISPAISIREASPATNSPATSSLSGWSLSGVSRIENQGSGTGKRMGFEGFGRRASVQVLQGEGLLGRKRRDSEGSSERGV